MGKILAIKGHPTRGKEVLEILEMLGGKNGLLGGGNKNFIYYIKPNHDYILVEDINNCNLNEFTIFTLEEFLEKYPYKVGNKVQDKGSTSCGDIYIIENMVWEDNQINYIVYNQCHEYPKCTVTAEYLQPYKEETMEERNEKSVNHVFNTEVISFDIAQKDKYELDLQGKFKVVLQEGKYYVERIKPKYPKTYEDCCRIVNANPCIRLVYNLSDGQKYYHDEDNLYLYENFRRLKICRDAYWKIAGEQMGLSESWKPNFGENFIYAIGAFYGTIQKTMVTGGRGILLFPTEEMRDAFYENFKFLIDKCKEFL